jgi:hypothetical protein
VLASSVMGLVGQAAAAMDALAAATVASVVMPNSR